jgi:hypothetical protein
LIFSLHLANKKKTNTGKRKRIERFPHSSQHNTNKEKDDAGEKYNWRSFVVEYSSSSFPVF